MIHKAHLTRDWPLPCWHHWLRVSLLVTPRLTMNNVPTLLAPVGPCLELIWILGPDLTRRVTRGDFTIKQEQCSFIDFFSHSANCFSENILKTKTYENLAKFLFFIFLFYLVKWVYRKPEEEKKLKETESAIQVQIQFEVACLTSWLVGWLVGFMAYQPL